MKDMSAKDQKKDAGKKGPKCGWCGQDVEQDILDDQFIETKLPLTKKQFALISVEKLNIQAARAKAQNIANNISKLVEKIAEDHELEYMIGLNVKLTGEEHMYEFFYLEQVGGPPTYLGVKLTKDEQKKLKALRWNAAHANQKISDATQKLEEAMLAIAKEVGWGFSPITETKGYLIAPDLIDDAYKRGKKTAEDKAERNKAKRR